MSIENNHPEWINELRDKYLAGESSIFILHGNVFDKVITPEHSLLVNDYLRDQLFAKSKSAVYEMSLAGGLKVVASKDGLESSFKSSERNAEDVMTSFGSALTSLENIFKKTSSALIIPYANTLLPSTDMAMMNNDERAALTTIHRWSMDDVLSKKDCVVVLICENLQDLNPMLLTSPRIAAIEVPMPDLKTRRRVVDNVASHLNDSTKELLSIHTAGLRAIQVESLVKPQNPSVLTEEDRENIIFDLIKGQNKSKDQSKARDRAKQLAAITAGKTKKEIVQLISPEGESVDEEVDDTEATIRVIVERKREIIEKECAGLLSFMTSKHGLEAVGGNEKLKVELMEIARKLKSGDRRLAPMGLLCVGPMGAGKTFVIRAFLKEAGLTGVALKNIRSKWQGSTEGNLERVLSTVKAMGPIAVVIDESDRSFGGKDQADTDGGVSSRVMARLKEFMSDTDNRGQVLFILMTNRPDRIEVDLKRPGRLDRKIPFFYCETAEERANVMKAVLRRDGGDKLQKEALMKVCEKMEGYSNADLEAVGLLALEFSTSEGKAITVKHISKAFEDFIPSREESMIKLMELLAAQETSRRSLLPDRFSKMTTQEINREISNYKAFLREEA